MNVLKVITAAPFWSSLSNFYFLLMTELDLGFSKKAFPAVSDFMYLFTVTFMSTVWGCCWLQRQQLGLKGGRGMLSLSLHGLVTLA